MGRVRLGSFLIPKCSVWEGRPRHAKQVGAPPTQKISKWSKNLYLGPNFDTQIQIFGGAKLGIVSSGPRHTKVFGLLFGSIFCNFSMPKYRFFGGPLLGGSLGMIPVGGRCYGWIFLPGFFKDRVSGKMILGWS